VRCNSQTLRLRRERVLRLAAKALGSDALARDWVKGPSIDGESPDALLDTTEGFERVLTELESLSQR
jgi:uncharacterized protein (DUF2384 family)